MGNIIGHEPIVSYFNDRSEQNDFNHAYLFVGPQKIGKQTLAKHLIASFFCEGVSSQSLFGTEESTNHRPCKECRSCKFLEQSTHPDLIYLSADEDDHSLSVERIRDILKKAYRSPSLSNNKYIVINDAHMMTKAASNALLKTLEEPPASCVIFLISHKPYLMPQTISSRCQIFDFDNISPPEDIERQDVWNYSRMLPGKYIDLLAADSFKELKDNIDQFIHLMLISKGERLKAIEPLFKKTKDHASSKHQWKSRLQLWQNICRDIIFTQAGLSDQVYYHQVSSAPMRTPVQLQETIDKLYEIQSGIDHNINLRLQIESLMLQI